jgi:hypothetical protein
MVLNSLRAIRTKHFHEFGELVICCDSGNYWRADLFPPYKASRKSNRKKDIKVDWGQIFDCLSTIRQELATYSPYTVIWTDKAEADDIIAILATDANPNCEPTLIQSGDKDFVQLQRGDHIKQWSPIEKKWMVPGDTIDKILLEHIVRGDRGDGIPNILSDDDTFIVPGKRQKSITAGYLQSWLDGTTHPLAEDDPTLARFKRNQALIDLRYIPLPIKTAINLSAKHAFARAKENGRHHLLNYFIHNKLKTLTEQINDF